METTDRFTLVREPAAPDGRERPPRAQVLRDGRSVNLVVAGALLEAAYRVTAFDFDLLFVSDDVPYEERLHIYLLDQNARLLDKRELGAAYTPGFLKDFDVVAPNEVEFSFQGRHTLTVSGTARGVFRRRYLQIRSRQP